MSLVYISWVLVSPGAEEETHGLELDASPARTTTISAQVTEHPVEKGPSITDYIRPMPKRLTMECFVTNTPLGDPPVLSSMGSAIQTEEKKEEIFYPTGFAAIRGPRPISWAALGYTDKFDRVHEAYGQLVDAILGGSLFSISTSLGFYESMAASSMTVSETTNAAEALQFSIEFQEVRIVETQTVAVPTRKAVVKTGPKAAKAATEAQKKKMSQSFLSADVSGPDQAPQ